MLQLKLFKVYGGEEKLTEVKSTFSNLIEFSDNIVGIPYDYGRNGYRKILEDIKSLSVKQYILTPEKFFKLINLSANKEYFIVNVNFLDSVPIEHQQVMDFYKNEINRASTIMEKKEKVNQYLSKLEWIVSEGSIDIKELGLRMKSNNTQLQVEVTFYNNGVLLIDNQNIIEQVIELIKSVE